MDSYFFIPALRKEFIEKRENIAASYFVFDFEDSIGHFNFAEAVQNCKNLTVLSNYYARPYWNIEDTDGSKKNLIEIMHLGFKNFVIPKFTSLAEVESIYEIIDNFVKGDQKIILLMENPDSVLQSTTILKRLPLHGISLGSHDYCATMGMVHTKDNIFWAKHFLLNHARANKVGFVDVASMNISDEPLFAEECQEAFNLGCDGKFIIHPRQLHVFNTTKYYSEDDLEIALKIRATIKDIGGKSYFTVLKYKGKAIEKPHLNRYNKILKIAGYETF